MPRGAWFGRLKTFRRRLRTRLPLRCLLVCWVGAIIRFHSTGLGPMGGIFLRHTSPFRHPCRDKFGGGFAAGFWEGGSQASLEPGPASRPSPHGRRFRPYLVHSHPSKMNSDLTVSRRPPLGRRRSSFARHWDRRGGWPLTSSFLHLRRIRRRFLPDIWDRTP